MKTEADLPVLKNEIREQKTDNNHSTFKKPPCE